MIIPDYQLQSLRTQGYAHYRVPTSDAQPVMEHLQKLRDDGVYLNSGWIAGQQPIELEQVQKTWVERWQEVV